MMYLVKWSYPNRNAFCKAWAVSFTKKREAQKWKEQFVARGDGRTASEVIEVRHKPWYHLRNTLATRRFACANMAKAAKAYADYIGSIGNECAYTDSLLDEVQKRLDELSKAMADYRLHDDAATCPDAGQDGDPMLDVE
jgi:hypothetical protein